MVRYDGIVAYHETNWPPTLAPFSTRPGRPGKPPMTASASSRAKDIGGHFEGKNFRKAIKAAQSLDAHHVYGPQWTRLTNEERLLRLDGFTPAGLSASPRPTTSATQQAAHRGAAFQNSIIEAKPKLSSSGRLRAPIVILQNFHRRNSSA